MTTDDGLHLLGTKPIHLLPPFFVALVGVISGIEVIVAFAAGIFTVLLFGNMRTVKTYRWRADQDAGNKCQD